MDEDEKDLIDEDLDDADESAESDDSGSDNSAPPKDDDSEAEGEKGRINDLMSKWQKAEARAKRAEAALATAKPKPDVKQGADAADDDKSDSEFVNFQRESVREALFNREPKFKDAGLSVDAISGNTVAEMKASAKAQLGIIDGIETRARNRILREHGLEPEVSTGAASEKTPNFGDMSQDDFEKFLKRRDSALR